MIKPKATVEAVIDYTDRVVGEIESKFYAQRKRPLSLTLREDHEWLNAHVDLDAEEDKAPFWLETAISYRTMRSFLIREGIFSYACAFTSDVYDAVMGMGRLYGNLPSREYAYRLELIKRLQRHGIAFPPDFEDYRTRLVEIKKSLVYELKEQRHFGYDLVNSLGDTLARAKTDVTFDALAECVRIKSVHPSLGKNPNFT